MARNDMKLPIFNVIKLEDVEKHLFLCESIWVVRQVKYEGIKMAHIIMTFKSTSLDWYMKFLASPAGTMQKDVSRD